MSGSPLDGITLGGILREIWKTLLGRSASQQLRDAGATPLGTLSMELPSFHTEPQAPTGELESRDLAHCHPELRRRYLALKADFERETGKQLFETCTWRSAERQRQLYEQGRTMPGQIVTKLDGTHKRSRHNIYPSEAVDVCVDMDPGPGKHPAWGPALYEPLGPLALRHGLRWGGDWNQNGLSNDEKFLDYPHLELPPGVA